MSTPEPETSPGLAIEDPEETQHVWRVGHAPDPWAWTPWGHADDEGRFGGRWDDQQGPRIHPSSEPDRVHPDLPELREAFTRFGLQWHED
ncbi:hypothetical protein [Arthrobacter sp.]|uniref:hypothetical protein n=1 Tax=Arthrobacter sp. TaxID=1667 RepID=UPI003A94A760